MQKEQNNTFQIKSKIRHNSLRLRKNISVHKYDRSYDIMKNFFKYFKPHKNDIIGLYWPMSAEIDTRPLISCLLQREIHIALPIISNKKMSFKSWDPSQKLYFSDLKFYSPSKKAKTVIPNIIITPALAVDYQGNRIGYGKGFYDSYYSQNKSLFFIGYVYSEQILKTLPFCKHDLKLNAMVTDTFVKIIDNRYT